jgi:protein-disulfide isomerase
LHATLALASVLACTKTGIGPASAGNGPLPPATEMATFDGKPITYADVVADKEVGSQFKQAESKALQDLYEVRKKAADQVVTRRLLEIEAAKAKKPLDEWFQKDFLNSVPEPSDAEVKASFEEHRSQLPPNANYDELKPRIAQFVRQDKARKVLASLVEGLKAKHNAKVTLVPPAVARVEVAAAGPSRGPDTAKVTIVEFSDFQCPYCSRAVPTVDRLMKDYDGKVRLVFRNFPLDMHPLAGKAAEAGACAADQNKFWQMHDRMFGDQNKLTVADLKKTAREIGIDGDRFDKCLDGGEKRQLVDADLKAGTDAGVSGTPAFFVNGVFINGSVPYEDFKQVLDRELDAKAKG